MAEHYHAVVWIDHHEARIVYFNADAAAETVVHPQDAPRHLHSKAGSVSGTHLHADPEFLGEVAAALAPAQAFLVTGPSTAKAELVEYLRRHAPQAAAHLSAVETAERLSDAQLIAEARTYFKAADRMTPQRG